MDTGIPRGTRRARNVTANASTARGGGGQTATTPTLQPPGAPQAGRRRVTPAHQTPHEAEGEATAPPPHPFRLHRSKCVAFSSLFHFSFAFRTSTWLSPFSVYTRYPRPKVLPGRSPFAFLPQTPSSTISLMQSMEFSGDEDVGMDIPPPAPSTPLPTPPAALRITDRCLLVPLKTRMPSLISKCIIVRLSFTHVMFIMESCWTTSCVVKLA